MSLIGPASRSKLYTLTFTHNKLSLAQDRANLAFFAQIYHLNLSLILPLIF